jgi:hypothetical protein
MSMAIGFGVTPMRFRTRRCLTYVGRYLLTIESLRVFSAFGTPDALHCVWRSDLCLPLACIVEFVRYASVERYEMR